MAVKEVIKVGVLTPEEDVVKYDSEGAKLQFDENDFKVLSSEVVQGLSKVNRAAYALTKLDYDVNSDEESGEVEERFNISPENRRTFTSDLLKVKVKKGLRKYHANPKDVDRFKRDGWDVARASDLADGGNEDSIRIKIGGFDDVVMMVTPEENYKKLQAEKKEFNEARRGKTTLAQGKKDLESVGHVAKMSEYTMTEEE